MKSIVKPLFAAAFLSLAGCASAYYGAMENIGYEKRDILVSRVKDARGEQMQAQKTFASALDEFRALVEVNDTKLEAQYDRMNASYTRANRQAAEVRERIKAVDNVGRRLFTEWERELGQYQSADLRRRSAAQLSATQADYAQLMAAMNRAAEKMTPVLALYHDQVLFLKHNLNARAVSSLDLERVKIEQRVEALIAEMNAAIAEADAFIAAMQ